jgi:hypothetical protein
MIEPVFPVAPKITLPSALPQQRMCFSMASRGLPNKFGLISPPSLLFYLYAQFNSKKVNRALSRICQPDLRRLFSRAISRSCSEPEKARPTCTP